MRSLSTLLHCVILGQISSALVTPSASISARNEETRTVDLYVKIDKADSQTRITIAAQSGETIAETCGSTLDSGPFADFKISAAALDQNGAGNITIGPNTFVVHSDPKQSNGLLTCTRMFDDTQAFVNCKAVIPASIRLSTVSKRAICFTSKIFPGSDEQEHDLEQISLGLVNQNINNGTSEPHAEISVSETERPAGLQERQTCDRWTYRTQTICDGDPRQNFFHQQVSERHFCGAAPECAISKGSYKSVTKGFEASATVYGWLSGGFAVQTSFESGNDQTCGGAPGDEICVWYKFAHTSLLVENLGRSGCGETTVSREFILSSPNVNNRGGRFYCVVGACRTIYDNYWENGFPGGPRK